MGAIVDYTQTSRSGLLYYRRAFPEDLRPFIPGSPGQLRKSLRNSSITAEGVMERYQAAAAEYGRLIAVARKAKNGTFDCLDDATIAYLAKVFERNMHEGDEASIRKRKAELVENGWDWFIDEYRQWRIEQDFQAAEAHWGRWAKGLLDCEDIRLQPGDGEGFERLCMALNDAAIGMFRDVKKRFAGDVIAIPPAPARPKREGASGEAGSQGLSFPKIVQKIHESPVHKLSETTKETGRTAVRYLREAFGDLSPKEITRGIVTEWLELLAMKPCRDLTQGDRKLGLRELVEKYGTVSSATTQGQTELPPRPVGRLVGTPPAFGWHPSCARWLSAP